MSRKFKVNEVLSEMSEEDRAAYDALLRDPATTVDDRFEFFIERGCKISRGAVWKHGKNFEDVLQKVRMQSEMAAAFGRVAREGGAEEIADSTILRLQQKLFGVAMELDDDTVLTPKEWSDLAKAARTLVGANGENKRLKRELEEERAKKDAAVTAAEKIAAGGGGASAVVATIKQALGITGGAA